MFHLEPTQLSGFGRATVAHGYAISPRSAEEVAAGFDFARDSGRKVVLRGAGRSYGDAAILEDGIAMEFSRFNRILDWDSESGVVTAEPGATLEDLWRRCLPDGWWPPVVSGTMFPTLGGALAMNIHGKNAFDAGTLGEHVAELSVLFPNGGLATLRPDDDLSYDVISSAGLLGAIVGIKLQMKRVESGLLEVHAVSAAGWEDQFAAFRNWRDRADYMVSWVDAFGNGRGQFHASRYVHEPDRASLDVRAQDLPSRILGVFPKSQVWRLLRLFTHRTGMRALNGAKFRASRLPGAARPHRQSLVGFSFLLDYVPNWEHAYRPGGFIQYQCFAPADRAPGLFAELFALQRAERLESYLSVLKLHRPDRFLFSHGVAGYSLAMDLKVPKGDWLRLERLCHRMNDLVIAAGGRFYFAKDSTLRPADVKAYLGEPTMGRYRRLKSECDPEGLLTSQLARRTGLAG